MAELRRDNPGGLGLCDRCVEVLRSSRAQGKNPARLAKIKKGQSGLATAAAVRLAASRSPNHARVNMATDDRRKRDELVWHIGDRTAWGEPGWDPPHGRQGLFPFMVLQNPDAGELVGLIRAYPGGDVSIDLLDGRWHDLGEVADWLRPAITPLSSFDFGLRLIALGKVAGIFELDSETWDTEKRPDPSVNLEMPGEWVEQRYRSGEKCRFRFKG